MIDLNWLDGAAWRIVHGGMNADDAGNAELTSSPVYDLFTLAGLVLSHGDTETAIKVADRGRSRMSFDEHVEDSHLSRRRSEEPSSAPRIAGSALAEAEDAGRHSPAHRRREDGEASVAKQHEPCLVERRRDGDCVRHATVCGRPLMPSTAQPCQPTRPGCGGLLSKGSFARLSAYAGRAPLHGRRPL